MAGTPEEYERMALKSMEKAAEDVSDTTYHLKRANIFATLATAAANEAAPSGPARSGSASRGAPTAQTPAPANGAPAQPTNEANQAEPLEIGGDDGRHLPAVRAKQ